MYTTASTPMNTPAPLDQPTTADRIARTGDHPAMRILSLLLRLLLASVFLVSGAEKLVAMKSFAGNIADYGILPVELSNIAAALFVWTEIVVALLLLAGLAIRGSALVTSGMLVLFLVAIISALARGLDIDCGCFANPEPIGWHKVWEDLALLAAALYLLFFPRSYFMMKAESNSHAA